MVCIRRPTTLKGKPVSIHSNTDSLDFSQETVKEVIGGRIIRGLVPMLVEAFGYGRALASGERFEPSSPGMGELLRAIDAIWFEQQSDRIAAFGDEADPRLLHDSVPQWLLDLPRNETGYPTPDLSFLPFDDTPTPPGPIVAHGIAPLPPLGGQVRGILKGHIR